MAWGIMLLRIAFVALTTLQMVDASGLVITTSTASRHAGSGGRLTIRLMDSEGNDKASESLPVPGRGVSTNWVPLAQWADGDRLHWSWGSSDGWFVGSMAISGFMLDGPPAPFWMEAPCEGGYPYHKEGGCHSSIEWTLRAPPPPPSPSPPPAPIDLQGVGTQAAKIDEDGGAGVGAAVGGAVGGLVALAIIIGLVVYIYMMKKKNTGNTSNNANNSTPAATETAVVQGVTMTALPVMPAPAQPAAQPKDTLAALRDLKGLLDDGTLTQKEFDAQKKVILGRGEKI